MNLCKKTLVCAVLFVCVLFLSCDKNDTAKKIKATDGHPVITEQPKSASYLEDETVKDLTVNASAKGEYTLSYQWYSMLYHVNSIYTNPTEQQILVEVNKLINDNLKDSQFKKAREDTNRITPFLDRGQTVYICIVTSTSPDGGETFTAVSDTAVITIIEHPLTVWYDIDRSPFKYRFPNDRFIDLRNITYGDGYFVAVGGRFRDYSMIPHGIIAYSSDRKTWNVKEDTIFDDFMIYTVAYGNDRFVAAGTNGKIAYSTDIKTWIPAKSPVSKSILDIVYGNGIFVASLESGLVYSDNGETWFVVEDFDITDISCIAYGNNRFIAGNKDGIISFSDNGKTWTTLEDDIFDSHSITAVSYGNGRFLALAYKSEGDPFDDDEKESYLMGSSDDGKMWHTYIPNQFSGYDIDWRRIKKIIYSEGYFIAIGDNKPAFSKGGENWNKYFGGQGDYYAYFPTEKKYNHNSVAYGDGYLVAAGNDGIVNYCQWPITKAIAPVITKQPMWYGDGSIKNQGFISSVEAFGVFFGDRSIQWYKNNTDNTDTGIAIEGANRPFYTPDFSKAGTAYYYVKVTNTIPDYFKVDDKNRSASVISETVAVTVGIPEEMAVKGLDE
jgi:hypothetical protein